MAQNRPLPYAASSSMWLPYEVQVRSIKKFTTRRRLILTYKIHLLRCYHHDEGI